MKMSTVAVLIVVAMAAVSCCQARATGRRYMYVDTENDDALMRSRRSPYGSAYPEESDQQEINEAEHLNRIEEKCNLPFGLTKLRMPTGAIAFYQAYTRNHSYEIEEMDVHGVIPGHSIWLICDSDAGYFGSDKRNYERRGGYGAFYKCPLSDEQTLLPYSNAAPFDNGCRRQSTDAPKRIRRSPYGSASLEESDQQEINDEEHLNRIKEKCNLPFDLTKLQMPTGARAFYQAYSHIHSYEIEEMDVHGVIPGKSIWLICDSHAGYFGNDKRNYEHRGGYGAFYKCPTSDGQTLVPYSHASPFDLGCRKQNRPISVRDEDAPLE